MRAYILIIAMMCASTYASCTQKQTNGSSPIAGSPGKLHQFEAKWPVDWPKGMRIDLGSNVFFDQFRQKGSNSTGYEVNFYSNASMPNMIEKVRQGLSSHYTRVDEKDLEFKGHWAFFIKDTDVNYSNKVVFVLAPRGEKLPSGQPVASIVRMSVNST